MRKNSPAPTGEGSQVTWCPWRFLRVDRGSVCIKYNLRDSHPSPSGRATGPHPFCGVTREEPVGLSRLEALVAHYSTFYSLKLANNRFRKPLFSKSDKPLGAARNHQRWWLKAGLVAERDRLAENDIHVACRWDFSVRAGGAATLVLMAAAGEEFFRTRGRRIAGDAWTCWRSRLPGR